MSAETHCPTCGSRVLVITAREGTTHYQPWGAAENESLRAERDTALRALENLSEDAAQLEAEDLRLHDLESRLGAMLLGFGGGHNHLDDIRAVLAAAGEPRP